jgi:hypothetical protein
MPLPQGRLTFLNTRIASANIDVAARAAAPKRREGEWERG